MRPSREAEYTDYIQGRLPWLRRAACLLCQHRQRADDLVQAAAELGCTPGTVKSQGYPRPAAAPRRLSRLRPAPDASHSTSVGNGMARPPAGEVLL